MRVDRARGLSTRVQAAINAGGMTKLTASPQQAQNNVSPPPLTQEQMAAAQNIQLDDEGKKAILAVVDEAEGHLAKSEFQAALDKYKQVMPVMPQLARAQAGMAWALIGLNRQPMAERVWG